MHGAEEGPADSGEDCIEAKWVHTAADCSLNPAVDVKYKHGGLYAISFCLETVGSYALAVFVNGQELAERVEMRCIRAVVRFDRTQGHKDIRLSEDCRKATANARSFLG